MNDMTPNRPYLLRAFNDWILDNELTPHLVVDATLPHVQVPQNAVKDGQIVLNINPTAVHGLQITDHHLAFSARFGGVPFEVYIPMYAISAIYARENGAGSYFPPDEYDLENIEPGLESADNENKDSKVELNEVSSNKNDPTKDDKPVKDKAKPSSDSKKRNHLSVVK